MDLYIYYRVRSANAGALQTQLLNIQARLAAEWQVQTDIKRRPEVQDNQQTWMETYINVPAAFLPALETVIAQTGISGLIEGERHLESFVDLDACA